jgi:CO/xanthine dehydrogenase Mo-binding subunit
MLNSDFYSDTVVPGMLFATVIHAPHGGILKTAAPGQDFPEGMYFYTAKDIPGENRVQTLGTGTPVFAGEKVRFAGEPVGIVAGENEEEVARAAAQAIVEIDPDPDSTGAPQKILTRTVRNFADGGEAEPQEDGLITIEGSYSISHASGILSEPAGCVASFVDGRLTVCCPTEWKRHLRENLSAALMASLSRISRAKGFPLPASARISMSIDAISPLRATELLCVMTQFSGFSKSRACSARESASFTARPESIAASPA